MLASCNLYTKIFGNRYVCDVVLSFMRFDVLKFWFRIFRKLSQWDHQCRSKVVLIAQTGKYMTFIDMANFRYHPVKTIFGYLNLKELRFARNLTIFGKVTKEIILSRLYSDFVFQLLCVK